MASRSVRAVLCALLLGALTGIAAAQTAPRKPAAQPAQRAVDDSRAQALLSEAQAALQRGDFAAAESAGRNLLDENARLFGADHPNVAVAHNVLGYALLRQGRFADAESAFRRMLAIAERALGPDHEFAASALNGLALVLERLGDYPGAETLLRRAHAILERTLGPKHPDTATTLSNLGRVLDSQGKFAATGAQKPAAGARPGAGDDPLQLAARAQQAMQRGELQEAETLHDRVLAIHEKTLGAEHPTTATSLSNLGNVLFLQGKHAEAERVYRRALAVREKVLGPEHPDVATSLNNLANAMQELGRDQQITLSEARARARTGGGVGPLTEVEGLYRRALAIQERSLGRDHPDTARTRNNLGVMYSIRGDFGQAEGMHRDALQTLEKVFGEQHVETAGVLVAPAMMLATSGRAASQLKASSVISRARVLQKPRSASTLPQFFSTWWCCANHAPSVRRAPLGIASRWYLPVSRPLASGKYGTSPRPQARIAGNSSFSGVRSSRLYSSWQPMKPTELISRAVQCASRTGVLSVSRRIATICRQAKQRISLHHLPLGQRA
jgi:tetratricopeptide (TPR) repeat protein